MKDKILVLDIETVGGFTPRDGFIVEIGIVELNIKTGKVKVLFDSVCRESGMTAKHRKSWIFENSDLTVQEVRDAKMFDEIKPQIQKIISKYKNGCTAYNHAFDFGHLKHRGIEFPKILDCPMKVLTPIMKLPKKKGFGHKWPSVTESVNYLFPDNKKYVEAHRGCSDAVDEAEIVYELIKRGIYKLKSE